MTKFSPAARLQILEDLLWEPVYSTKTGEFLYRRPRGLISEKEALQLLLNGACPDCNDTGCSGGHCRLRNS